jgi:hypothetical protein
MCADEFKYDEFDDSDVFTKLLSYSNCKLRVGRKLLKKAWGTI